ncbi:MAG: hypothetical protein DMF58_00905 [Acidobacteria bacterium]|nr:MAG: hypothetical protein DMF58_00905 [Acidobacteriota bacterium]
MIVAAAARLLMQCAAMPPYAGLDELYHVARLSFVRAQHRNPTITEPSIPQYLASIPRWPDSRVIVDRRVDSHYVSPNYEAQQPSLYYSVVAPLVPGRSAMFELRAWRMLSVFFALIIVLATASIDWRAALLIVSLPTWETLVTRASNDAFACAIVTIGIAASMHRKTVVEAIAWPLAIAAKLYTWPMLIVLPVLWRSQRAGWRRMVFVSVACAIALSLTIVDLSHRTRNPLGLFAFRIGDMVKIWIATLAWTSGPHLDALKPLAIVIYLLPFAIAVARSRGPAVAWWAIGAFAFAQVINAAAYARNAPNGLPAGGKEGWYWYALAPIVVPFFLSRFRAITWWIVGWDVLITDVALFHDYSGASSPAHPTALFRWGPWHWPFTAHLAGIGVGPFVAAIVVLRLIHLAAFFALQSLATDDRSHNLPLPSS